MKEEKQMNSKLTNIDLIMVGIYASLIRSRKRTLESVPEQIRELVKARLIEWGVYKETVVDPVTGVETVVSTSNTTEGEEKAE